MFSPNELLTWQQMASYWSTYARKEKRVEPLDNDIDTENIPSDAYFTDPNLLSNDNLVQQLTNSAMDDL